VPLNIGSYVGPYRILSLIMTGQSSQVWEVLHDAKQQRFALKILLSDKRSDRQQVSFMRHEWEVGAKLNHPHVIKMVEFNTYQGDPYLALELFRHPNLKHLLLRKRERVVYQAAKLIEGAALGLAYLHSTGWVHGDVKPDNFLASPEGYVKLIDFALASRPPSALARLLPRRGKIQGTRSYMSPEQIRGQALDPRADLYSFGCAIHEMLTGKPPYTGTDTNELLNRHLSSAVPSLVTQNSNVTSDFAALVRRCLSKKADDRPRTVDEFLLEFRGLKLFREAPRPPAEVGSN
jgi:serine/threonine protein kinase